MARVQKAAAAAEAKGDGFQYSSMMHAQAAADGPNQDQIARRAYELFIDRGGEHGHDMEDWLQAERELRLGRYN